MRFAGALHSTSLFPSSIWFILSVDRGLGGTGATKKLRSRNSLQHHQHHFHRFFPSSRELSPSWVATKCNAYYRKTQCSLALSTKHHIKMRIFKTLKISVNTRICTSVLQERTHAHVHPGSYRCSSDHNISPWTEKPILARGHQKCGFLMALPVGCTLAAQMWQRRNLFLIVLLFQAQHNEE